MHAYICTYIHTNIKNRPKSFRPKWSFIESTPGRAHGGRVGRGGHDDRVLHQDDLVGADVPGGNQTPEQTQTTAFN
jgi:hypothetical protein